MNEQFVEKIKNIDNCVAKCLVLSDKNDGEYLFKDSLFQKQILIVRDPRDIIISYLLYTGGYNLLWDKPKEKIYNALRILMEKEFLTKSVRFSSVVKSIRGEETCMRLARGYACVHFNHLINNIRNYKLRNKKLHILKYEDFVVNNLSSLESYLGFKLVNNDEIDMTFSRVIRTKNFGNWRNWLTKESVELFRDCK